MGRRASAPAVASAPPAQTTKKRGRPATRNRRVRQPDPDLEAIKQLAVTVERAAKMLMVCKSTMQKLVMRGEIESFKVGNSRRIPVRALESYVSSRAA